MSLFLTTMPSRWANTVPPSTYRPLDFLRKSLCVLASPSPVPLVLSADHFLRDLAMEVSEVLVLR